MSKIYTIKKLKCLLNDDSAGEYKVWMNGSKSYILGGLNYDTF
ncbi:MAG: hypothetical protein ACXAD7_09610 [Candidatus Kariarchaeaceae archaeon]